jgi:hypothetical protein
VDESRALRRIETWIFILTLGGAIAGAVDGLRWSGGFLAGAAASWLNFRWLKQLVRSLSDAVTGPRKPPRKRVAVLLGLRYLILGAGAYVILNYSDLSLAAALAGLFVPVAAVLIEILFELIYAGT